MTAREDMIETATRALAPWDGLALNVHRYMAEAVLNAVLPQITTVEQLDWYGDGTRLLDKDARLILTLSSPYLDEPVLGLFLIPDALERFGPLTVVWQPAPPEADR